MTDTYADVPKGLHHLGRLFTCHPKTNTPLVRRLSVALHVSQDVLVAAIERSHAELREAEEAAWRRVFVPHAIIATERAIPDTIFVAAVVGLAKLKWIDFDASLSPDQIHALIQAEIARSQKTSGTITSFGRATGYVVVVNRGCR